MIHASRSWPSHLTIFFLQSIHVVKDFLSRPVFNTPPCVFPLTPASSSVLHCLHLSASLSLLFTLVFCSVPVGVSRGLWLSAPLVWSHWSETPQHSRALYSWVCNCSNTQTSHLKTLLNLALSLYLIMPPPYFPSAPMYRCTASCT